ncbi:MAG: PIG-L family deacetylase [Opitutaceae bacterium]|jgi:LmbE family N-acetylglucosaminyl deacetylase
MPNPYRDFVSSVSSAMASAKQIPLAQARIAARPAPAPNAPEVLIFSPHPDDEAIIGALALRLLRQSGWRTSNVAVTQGSNKQRQAGRLAELAACCGAIGFGLIQTRENGLEGISLKGRASDPAGWDRSVARIAAILGEHKPRVILFPHERDWNGTHIGTHHLVVEALGRMEAGFSCHTVETEFWGAMDDPNLMVETSEEDLADLMAALSYHVGEVDRNPYHLRLPAWMIDNVRRGGEIVGGQGAAVPDFTFATLYRLRRWRNGRFEPVLAKGRFLAASEDPSSLFA